MEDFYFLVVMNYCVKHAVEKLEVNQVTNCQPCSDRVTLRCKFDTDLSEDSWYLKSYYLACGRLQDIPAGVLAPTDDVTRSGCDKRSGSIYMVPLLRIVLAFGSPLCCVTAALCGELDWYF